MKRRSPPVADSRRLYKVFVSSTFLDNQERRKLVQDAITMAGMVWHGMEIFTASTRPTVEECLRYAKEADLLLGIIARRYGWEPDGNQSITEMEYDAAKERLMFLIDPNLPVNEEKDYDPGEERWDKQKKLAAFKKRIAGDQMPALFIETMLAAKVLKALDDWRNKFEPRPQPEAEVKHLVQWTGVPYPGLPAFKPEQAPIFFGRGPEIDQFLELLLDPAIRFLAVAGASGSGKSSLVAAGLIPRLRAGALPGSDQWIDITFRPTERGDNPFLALAYALKTSLDADGQRETELAKDLRATPASLATCAGKLLAGRAQGAELLLVVDQFEEIFTRVNADLQRSFVELIETASRTARVRLIATIRSDFTANIADSHALAQLFMGRGYFLLSAPGPLALADMIRRPAQLAGLELKDDLCERILKDTGTGSGALALMAFALHEVYQRGKDSGRLTLQDYEALGGVSGAIKAQAERALERAGQTDERALYALFSGLVEVNDQAVATRRRADLGEIRKNSSAARVADVLVDARILNAGSEPSHTPTIEVAHEAVFGAWPRLSTWIDSHAGELRTCRRLIRAAQDWKEAGAPRFKHLPDRATMKQYRKVRPVCPLGDDAEIVRRFLGAARTRQRAFTCLLVIVVFLFSILGTEIWLRSREMNWNVLRIWTLAQVGLYDGPPMMVIPAGSFEMGDSDCTPDDKRDECPQHSVVIQAFEMGKYEVTFDEYSAFVLDTGYSNLPPNHEGWGHGSRPVMNVSWEDAQAYIRWLNGKVRHNNTFRLPTEAEWEYACRANTKTLYHSGNTEKDLKQVGWYAENSGNQTHPVGENKFNAFGLYDMHGNVWEWCQDWYGKDYYKISPEEHPQGPKTGSDRVVRGGSWSDDAQICRSATRTIYGPDDSYDDVGFRLSRSVALGP